MSEASEKLSPYQLKCLQAAADEPNDNRMSLVYAPDLRALLAERTEMEKENETLSTAGAGLCEEHTRLTLERDRLLAERTWRPIEEAPLDGTPVLAWAPKRREPCIAFYSTGNWWAEDNCPEVTHWMPLPPPPEAKQPQELPLPRLPPREEP